MVTFYHVSDVFFTAPTQRGTNGGTNVCELLHNIYVLGILRVHIVNWCAQCNRLVLQCIAMQQSGHILCIAAHRWQSIWIVAPLRVQLWASDQKWLFSQLDSDGKCHL